MPFTNDGSSISGQLIGAATIFVWVFVVSLVVWLVIKAVMGVRVSEEEEFDGVDMTNVVWKHTQTSQAAVREGLD